MSEDIYCEANVPVFEAIYGKGLISLGGLAAVDTMFAGVHLDGKRLLDIGSGIGGMAHYLAKKHNCHVTGLELYPWMAEYALKNAPSEAKGKLEFIHYDELGHIPLPPQNIDIVYSKGVLTNVKDKEALFLQIYHLLKSPGKIVFIDWLMPGTEGVVSEQLKMGDMSFKETQSSYSAILTAVGFQDIQFEDRSQEYLHYVNALDVMYHSQDHIEKYQDIIDPKLRDSLIKANCVLKQSIESKKQLSMRIIATK